MSVLDKDYELGSVDVYEGYVNFSYEGGEYWLTLGGAGVWKETDEDFGEVYINCTPQALYFLAEQVATAIGKLLEYAELEEADA